MEATEQTAVAKNCVHAIVRGKRTKRRRLHLPPSAPSAAASSSSSSCTELPPSTTLTEEEEDMANCLILLAHGRVFDANPKPEAFAEDGISGHERFMSRRFAEAATTSNGKAGFCVYECKTCNKCFPSFQALGGHRASHKKPKIGIMAAPVALEKKAMIDEVDLQISMNNFSKPIILPANGNVKTKVHECSICGAEFSSGQALGGHMRRHRPLTIPEAQEAKREQSQRLLSLDLNLPAPSDDDRGEFARPPEVFAFVEKRPLLLSASALVDCHY